MLPCGKAGSAVSTRLDSSALRGGSVRWPTRVILQLILTGAWGINLRPAGLETARDRTDGVRQSAVPNSLNRGGFETVPNSVFLHRFGSSFHRNSPLSHCQRVVDICVFVFEVFRALATPAAQRMTRRCGRSQRGTCSIGEEYALTAYRCCSMMSSTQRSAPLLSCPFASNFNSQERVSAL